MPRFNFNKGNHYERPTRVKRPINPMAQRDYLLKTKYGITLEQYGEMKASQDGKCAICQIEAPLSVDHCHRSGKVRALLCHNCNGGLGVFRDDIAVMAKAIEYVRKHAEAEDC